MDMGAGVEAAVLAALLYNLAIVIQKTQAERADASGVRIIGALWRRPLWLLGILLQLAGFALHAFALTRAPVTVVQPIIASGIVFVVLFAGLLLGERPHGREIAGMGMSTAGVCLLVARADPLAAMAHVAVQDLVLAVGTAAALAAGLLYARGAIGIRSPSLRAALIGTAAGIGDGMSDSMNRLAGTWLSPQGGWIPPASMGVAAIALLFSFGFLGFVAAQNGLKQHRANTVAPFTLTAQMLVPIAMGATIYGQSIPEGGLSLAGWLAALALVAAGIVTLSSSAPVAAIHAPAAAEFGE
jgi:drug/metabolite transporter (DMT)-like permease